MADFVNRKYRPTVFRSIPSSRAICRRDQPRSLKFVILYRGFRGANFDRPVRVWAAPADLTSERPVSRTKIRAFCQELLTDSFGCSLKLKRLEMRTIQFRDSEPILADLVALQG
jgi:hypothetical protein